MRRGRDTYPVLSFVAVVGGFGLVGWFLHPVFGWVGGIFDFVAEAIDSLTQGMVQAVISVLAAAAAVLWVRRFLSRRRTPAGLMKLSDDDYFRIIFAAAGAVIVILFVTVGWPGLSSWLINSGRDLFEVLGDKFGDGRTGQPIDAKRPDIEQVGNFPNYGPAGLNLTQGLAAVYFGVVLYTAAFIAEIVRGGILAVPKGQTEAAQAVGLRPRDHAAARGPAPSVPCDPASAGQPVPEPHQEHVAGHCRRLQRRSAGRSEHLQPDR